MRKKCIVLLLVFLSGIAFSGCLSLNDNSTVIPEETEDLGDTLIDEVVVMEPGTYIEFSYAMVPYGKHIVGHIEVEENETVDFYFLDTMGSYLRFTNGESSFYYDKEVSGLGITEKDFDVAAKRNSPYFFIIDNTLSNKTKTVKLYIDVQ